MPKQYNISQNWYIVFTLLVKIFYTIYSFGLQCSYIAADKTGNFSLKKGPMAGLERNRPPHPEEFCEWQKET